MCSYKVGTRASVLNIQWNLSNTDTLATKVIVLIIEVSMFQGDKVGTQSSVLIDQVYEWGSTVLNFNGVNVMGEMFLILEYLSREKAGRGGLPWQLGLLKSGQGLGKEGT